MKTVGIIGGIGPESTIGHDVNTHQKYCCKVLVVSGKHGVRGIK